LTIFRPTKSAQRVAAALLTTILIAAPARGDEGNWDVIVVGAGLAGLAAADALSGHRVLVLERDAQPGGRARPRTRGAGTYELGALVPPSPEHAPLPEGLRTVESPTRLGVSLRGAVVFGPRLDALGTKLPAGTGTELKEFADGDIADPNALSPTAQRILQSAAALFTLSSLDTTSTPVARMSLGGLPGVALVGGYRSLIDALARPLGDRLRTGAEVIRVTPEGRGVRVYWRRGGWEHESLARVAIVATEAPTVSRLVEGLFVDAAAGLAALDFAQGVTVAIGVRDLDWPSFTAVYIPSPGAHAVLRHPGEAQSRTTVLYVYYGDRAARDLAKATDDAVLADARRVLQDLGLGQVPDDDIAFQDLQRWDHALPNPRPGVSRPSWTTRARAGERIWLAGDHVGAPETDGGGAGAAIKSGRAAAAAVLELLNTED